MRGSSDEWSLDGECPASREDGTVLGLQCWLMYENEHTETSGVGLSYSSKATSMNTKSVMGTLRPMRKAYLLSKTTVCTSEVIWATPKDAAVRTNNKLRMNMLDEASPDALLLGAEVSLVDYAVFYTPRR